MSIVSLLFSFRGRIGRLPFLGTSTLVTVLFFVILGVVIGSALTGIDFQSPEAGKLVLLALGEAAWVVAPLSLLYFWVSMSLAVKRLHDRNRSAWWLIPYVGLVLVPYINFLVMIWYFIEVACLPGTPGANRFDVEAASGAATRDNTDGAGTASWAENLDIEKLAQQSMSQDYEPRVLRKRKPAPETAGRPSGFGRRGLPA